MYERFTDRARKVMQLANQECDLLHHEYIGTEHLLLGLLKEGSGVAANVLKNLGLDLTKLRDEVNAVVQPSDPDEPRSGLTTLGIPAFQQRSDSAPASSLFVDRSAGYFPKKPLTPRSKQAIEFAIAEAKSLDHNYIGTEYLLLGILSVKEGIACQVLLNFNVKLEDVREEIMNFLGHSKETEEDVREEIMNLLGHSKETEAAVKGALQAMAVWKVVVTETNRHTLAEMVVTETDRHMLAEIERIVNFVPDPAEAVAQIKKLFTN